MSITEFHASRSFVKTPYGEIAYVERGSGPVALFVHSSFLNGYQWRHQLAAMSDIRRCIAIDSMGMGYSKIAPDQELGLAEQGEMIAAFLDALGIDKADLVGNDTGGAMVQVFAANHPERVRSILLTNCQVHSFDENESPASDLLREALPSGQLARSMQLAANNPAEGKMAFIVVYEDIAAVDPEIIRTYAEPITSSPERLKMMERYFAAAITSEDLVAISEDLKKVEAPVVIVWGTGDVFFPVKWAYWLKDTLPNVRDVIELEGAKTYFPEERPEVLTRELRKLWTSTDNR